MNPAIATKSRLSPRGWDRLTLMARFGWQRGANAREKLRLFYQAGVKPSLVHRGWGALQPDKLQEFEIKVAPSRRFRVQLRDNQFDMTTFAEFFSAQHAIIPTQMPPFVPKVIYDIGANIGIASLYFAARYPQAQCFGFEPVPSNFQICSANYGNLPQGRMFPWAVGAHSGSATFEFDEADLRGGRLEATQPGGDKPAHQRLTVPVVSIADLVTEQQLTPPDFVKIDVEGAEMAVLAGIGPCLPHIQRVLIETHGVELLKQCLAWLQANGFVIQDVHEVAPGFAAIWADR